MAPTIQRFYNDYHADNWLDGQRLISLQVAPPIQETKPQVEVYGVPIYSWGSNVAGFKSATGLTIPIIGDPGLPVDTSRHPVSVFYNKTTGVHRVAAVGVVSYQTLVDQYYAFGENRSASTAGGSS